MEARSSSILSAFAPSFVSSNRHAALGAASEAVSEVDTSPIPITYNQETGLPEPASINRYDPMNYVAVGINAKTLNDPSLQLLSSEVGVKKWLREGKVPEMIMQKKSAGKHGSEGPLAPAVLLAKSILGDEKLNKIRAKAISLHADTIKGFIDLADTATGQSVMKTLFTVADKNHDGKLEEDELAEVLHSLGFEWLKEKQVHGILERADSDHNGYIDPEEWIREAPKTLRTNFVKLAKTNGGRLGLLA